MRVSKPFPNLHETEHQQRMATCQLAKFSQVLMTFGPAKQCDDIARRNPAVVFPGKDS